MAEVNKSAFALSGATLMIGKAFVDDVFALNETNSVGMAQELRVSLDSSRNELLNGVSQSVVDSKRTNVRPSITGNIFEFTAANMLRGQGLANAPIAPLRGALTAAADAAAVSLTLSSDPIPGESTSAITTADQIPAGSTLLIQMPDSDIVFPTKSSGPATLATTVFTVPIAGDFKIPAGMSFPAGAKVWVVQEVPLGSIAEDDLFCVKISGKLSNFDRPVVVIAPKVRMVKGFEVAFSETQYGSMPWEMSPQLMSRTEVTSKPRLTEIGTRASGKVYVGG